MARGRRAAITAMALAAACVLWAAALRHREIGALIERWRIGRELDSLLAAAAGCGELDGPAIERIRPAADALARRGAAAVPVLADRLARGDPPDPWRRKWILHVLVRAVPPPASRSMWATRPPRVDIGSDAMCTEDFSASYGRSLEAAYDFPADLPLLPAETIPSPGGAWKARFRTTNSGVVPYEEERAAIDFERGDGAERHVVLEHFRFVRFYWLTDRLVLLDCDLGHAAGALQLYDVEEGRWLYRMGESYF